MNKYDWSQHEYDGLTNRPSKGYGQMYRSGITIKEKQSTERRIERDRKESDRLLHGGKSLMGKNE